MSRLFDEYIHTYTQYIWFVAAFIYAAGRPKHVSEIANVRPAAAIWVIVATFVTRGSLAAKEMEREHQQVLESRNFTNGTCSVDVRVVW